MVRKKRTIHQMMMPRMKMTVIVTVKRMNQESRSQDLTRIAKRMIVIVKKLIVMRSQRMSKMTKKEKMVKKVKKVKMNLKKKKVKTKTRKRKRMHLNPRRKRIKWAIAKTYLRKLIRMERANSRILVRI